VTGRGRVNLAEVGVLGVVAVVVIVFFLDVHSYSPAARLVPVIFLYVAAVLLALSAFFLVRRAMAGEADASVEAEPLAPEDAGIAGAGDRDGRAGPAARTAIVIGSVLAYLALIQIIGLYYAIPVFVFLFARFLGGIGWLTAGMIAFGTWLFTYLLFVRLLGLPTLSGIVWP